MLLNEGSVNPLNPAVSTIMVICESAKENEKYWTKLIEHEKIFMPVDRYDWSIRYSWVRDKYGVN